MFIMVFFLVVVHFMYCLGIPPCVNADWISCIAPSAGGALVGVWLSVSGCPPPQHPDRQQPFITSWPSVSYTLLSPFLIMLQVFETTAFCNSRKMLFWSSKADRWFLSSFGISPVTTVIIETVFILFTCHIFSGISHIKVNRYYSICHYATSPY